MDQSDLDTRWWNFSREVVATTVFAACGACGPASDPPATGDGSGDTSIGDTSIGDTSIGGTEEPSEGSGGPTGGQTTTGEGSTSGSSGQGNGPADCECAEDEVCVAWADDVCLFGGGFTKMCMSRSECEGECSCEEICEAACVPACDYSEDDVEFWCGSVNIPTCDVLEQNCPEGEKCVPYAAGGEGSWNEVECTEIIGQAGLGDACTYEGGIVPTDDCDAGLVCTSGEFLDQCEGEFCCTALCELDDPAACAGLEPLICLSYFDPEAPPGMFEEIGACMSP